MFFDKPLSSKGKLLITLSVLLLFFSKWVLGETLLGNVAFEVNTVATCDVLINEQQYYEYDLGVLTLGQNKRHKPLDVLIKCDSPGLSTALSASVTKGELKSDGVEFNIGERPAGILKLLMDDDKPVPLDKKQFCKGTAENNRYDRVCRLTPLTNIYQDSKGGSFNVGVNIDVIIN